MLSILLGILGVFLLFLIYIICTLNEKKDCTEWVKRKSKALTKMNFKKMKF
jgi:hypothetical protein